MRFLASLLSFCLLAMPLHAATLETTITPEMSEMGCSARLVGTIEAGDLERIQSYLDRSIPEDTDDFDPYSDSPSWRNFSPAVTYGQPGRFIHRLCLNSPGGSLTEAMRIAAYLRAHPGGGIGQAYGLPTAIARGDRCESACAFIFFAGRFVFYPGVANYEGHENFLLNPEGRLGLHAPFLSFDQPAYSNPEIRTIWRIGMEATALISRNVSNGNIQMPRDLFTEMLTYPADDMLYMETVGQAVRWGLQVVPNITHHGYFPFSEDDVFSSLCLNAPPLAPVYVDLYTDKVTLQGSRTEGDTVVSKQDFTDRRSGYRFACKVERSQLALPEERDVIAPLNRPLVEGDQTVFPGTTDACFRVSYFSSDCEQCEFSVDLPCIAAFPPETRLPDLAALADR